jgi:predicted MPP superfamily phosphohydrolase
MLEHWLSVALAEVGNLCIFCYVINRLHAIGFREWQKPVPTLALAAACSAGAFALVFLPPSLRSATWFWAYERICLAIALLGLPLTTLALLFRSRPQGVLKEQSTEVDLAAQLGREALIGPGPRNWLLRLPGSTSLRFRQSEWTVPLPGLPMACDGLSVLHLSDLHFGPCYAMRYFEEALDAAAAWDCDLVVFTGDLIDDEKCMGWIEPVLSKVSGRLGTYGVLGNHDFAFDARRIRNCLERAGFEDIEGRWARLDVPGARIALGGTAAPWGRGLDLTSAPFADFAILLSHSPDLFPRAARAGIDLVLAGHNHGGQVRLPVWGPPFIPSRYGRHFDRGFFQIGKSLLHVSEGLGAKHPVRYGTTPEITRLVLRVATTDGLSIGTALPHMRATEQGARI